MRNTAFGIVAAAVLAGSALAQGGPGRGPGGPGGPGGPPSGTNSSSTGTARSQAVGQSSQSQSQSQTSVYLQLLNRSDVQSDIQLSISQRSQLGSVTQRSSGLDDSATIAKLATVLSAAQVTRLKQLYVQYLGYGSLKSAEVQDAISLTAAQKAQVAQIFSPTTSRQSQSSINAALAKVLTSTQDTQLRALAGKALGRRSSRGGA